MPRRGSIFYVPAKLLPQLQAFVREECVAAAKSGNGSVLLTVESHDKTDEGSFFLVRLIGSPVPVKRLYGLCLAAEEGVVRYLQPVNRRSRPVGKPGEKIDVEVTLYSLADFDSQYGHTYIYRFRDTFGNELSWRTTSRNVHERGEYLLNGKVKEHAREGCTTVTRLGYVKLQSKV